MDPKSNSAVAPGSKFYRNQQGFYECPIKGCGMIFKDPEGMSWHIHKLHTYAQSPQSSIAPSSRTTSPLTPNLTGGPTPVQIPQVRRVSGTAIARTPSPLSQSQPLSIPQDGAALPAQSWGEQVTWPPETIKLLKSLIIKKGLFSEPQTPREYTILGQVFREFYDQIDFPRYKPSFEDEKFSQLFKAKLRQIQHEMLMTGEICQTSTGLQLSKLPTALRIVPSAAPSNSTPPTTPKLPTHQLSEGLSLWQSMDGNTQTRFFHELLRAAKDQEALVSEFDQYRAEVHPHQRPSSTNTTLEQSSDQIEGRSIPGLQSFDSNVRTPVETPPPPEVPVMTDLKTILEARRLEAKLKRQRDKEAGEEAERVKRLKTQPH